MSYGVPGTNTSPTRQLSKALTTAHERAKKRGLDPKRTKERLTVIKGTRIAVAEVNTDGACACSYYPDISGATDRECAAIDKWNKQRNLPGAKEDPRP